MPRYKYPQLVPIIKELAARHGLTYREENEFAMVWRNYTNYNRVGQLPPNPGAPASKKGQTI